MPNHPETPVAREIVPHTAGRNRVSCVVCAACGCLCDDIELAMEGGRIVEARNACPMGIDWFQAESLSARTPASLNRVEDQNSEFAAAVARSAELLSNSRAPLIIGLTQTTIETARVALELADKIGAVIDPGLTGRSSEQVEALQREGRVTATLGEVKNRADVVVFWGVDPVATHPRHAERYSIDATGRFREDGRSGRTVIAIGDPASVTARRADYVLELSSDREFSTLWALRAILSGKPLDPARASHLTGHSLDELGKIVATLKDANYVAIFSDLDFRGTRRMASEFEAMARLVRELSQETRCVSLPLGGPGNRAGAEGVATWQTGFPLGVDLASGGPSSIPGISSAIDRLSRREADLAVIVADAIPDDLPPRAIERLEAIPKIVIAPATVPYNFTPTVRFATENPFLSSRGTVIRCDGVPLPLRAPIATESPSDAECLRAISSKLDEPGFSTRTRR